MIDYSNFIGSYCILRATQMGVVAGFVEQIDGSTVVVREPRQLFDWSSSFVLIDLAAFGPRRESEQRYSAPGAEPLVMTEVCGIIKCHPEAAKKIQAIKAQDCK